jgi:hypothetical protein
VGRRFSPGDEERELREKRETNPLLLWPFAPDGLGRVADERERGWGFLLVGAASAPKNKNQSGK